ncbi:MAG: GNAT family N-acetyltransferase [Rhizobacter sp.]|nr:GNAT family N-acetyltransferase [Ferruginibacter sp.]
MIFREARVSDIPQIQVVRNAVKENRLSNPALVSDADCEEFMMDRGKGWVCITNDTVVGFAIADLKEDNIWALFVDPVFEGKGIGKQLHCLMMDWYFTQNKQHVWLGTSPGTKAEIFYANHGLTATGTVHKNETKFEMTATEWKLFKNK